MPFTLLPPSRSGTRFFSGCFMECSGEGLADGVSASAPPGRPHHEHLSRTPYLKGVSVDLHKPFLCTLPAPRHLALNSGFLSELACLFFRGAGYRQNICVLRLVPTPLLFPQAKSFGLRQAYWDCNVAIKSRFSFPSERAPLLRPSYFKKVFPPPRKQNTKTINKHPGPRVGGRGGAWLNGGNLVGGVGGGGGVGVVAVGEQGLLYSLVAADNAPSPPFSLQPQQVAMLYARPIDHPLENSFFFSAMVFPFAAFRLF